MRDNQQVSLDLDELRDCIWVAGLFDGDGCVSMYRHDDKKGYHIRVVEAVWTCSSEPGARRVSDYLKRNGVKHIYRTQPKRGENLRAIRRVVVNNFRPISRLCDLIWEELTIKRGEFSAMMQYVDDALDHLDRRIPWSWEDRQASFDRAQAKLHAIREAYLRDYTRYSARVIYPDR